MKKFLIFLAGLLLGIIFFMPKDNLYYTAQKFLAKENIYINSSVKSGINLDLTNGKVYQNGIEFMDFQEIKVTPFLVFNKIKANNIKINFQNLNINNINITYSIINPLKVYISGTSNFGKIKGNINLIKKEVKVYILNLTNNNLKSFLRKDKKGYFYYAKF